jgi:BTB/POZ domain
MLLLKDRDRGENRMNEYMNKKNIGDIEEIMKEIVMAKEKVKKTITSWENVLDELDRRAIEYEVIYDNMKEAEEEDKIRRDKVESNMKLNLRGKRFDTSKDVLVKAGSTYFSLLLSSPLFELDCDGVYFIDRTSVGFDRILDYMNTGVLSLEGLNKYEVDCIYDKLDYFKIPHKAQIDYSRGSSVEGLRMDVLLQLRDGRLCGRTNDSSIHIWSMDTNMIEITLKGFTANISEITEDANGWLRVEVLRIRSDQEWASKTYGFSLLKDGKLSGEIADKVVHTLNTVYHSYSVEVIVTLTVLLPLLIAMPFGLLYFILWLLSIPLCPQPRPPVGREYEEYLGLCMDSYLSRWITRG